MSYQAIKLVGLVVGGLVAVLVHRLARERRPLPRRLAALAALLGGAAMATALARSSLADVLYDDPLREAASRVIVLELAASATGLAGAGLLAARRGPAAIVAGLTLLLLTWRLLLAFAAWSLAVWGEPMITADARLQIDLGTHIIIAFTLLVGALAPRRAPQS